MDARDRPALRIDRDDAVHECGSIVGKFGDLDLKANRIRYVQARMLNYVFPSSNGDEFDFEAAFWALPKSTMDKVVATTAQLSEAFSQSRALLLKSFEARDVPERHPETRDPVA